MTRTSLLGQALYRLRKVFIVAGVFSCFINIVMLNGPLFMLQVYDRVLTSRSYETLLFLTLLAFGLLAFQALIEVSRAQLLVRAAAQIDTDLSRDTFSLSLGGKSPSTSAQGLRDLDMVRGFLCGPGLITLFDAPWTPIFLFLVFMLHPLLGLLALTGAVIILGLAIASEFATRGALAEAMTAGRDSEYFVATLHNNSESARAMGMAGNLEKRWLEHHGAGIAWQSLASERSARLSAAAKMTRQGLQTFALALGAYLALENMITAGSIVAASILMGRALAPIEQTIGQWKGFVQARQAYARLSAVLHAEAQAGPRTELPPPEGVFKLENVSMQFQGVKEPTLRGVSFELNAGEVLGIIGPTGSGKSTLARLMIGAWKPSGGSVRVDGVEVSEWPVSEFGPHVGYLAQDVELMDGTIAENISRYGTHDSPAIIEAAKLAGAHEFILQQPNMYETVIGERGRFLSGGQRQRVGMARAVFGKSKVVVLDEPNANLDAVGEIELRRTVQQLKAQGRTVVIVTHRAGILPAVDKIAVLKDGQIISFGARDEILAALNKPMPPEVKPAATNANVTNLETRYASNQAQPA